MSPSEPGPSVPGGASNGTTTTSDPQTEGLRSDLRYALARSAPVGMGYLALGGAFGVLLTNAGIAWYWSTLTSFFVFAGSIQFLAVGLFSGGVGLASIATATLAVNFRHVFYGLSFPRHLIGSRAGRLYSTWVLTDESYSVVTSCDRRDLNGRRVLLIQILSHTYWVGASTLGALLASSLPMRWEGLDFALTALFLVLAMDAVLPVSAETGRRKGTATATRAAVLGGVACLPALAFPDNFLALALGAFVVLIIGDYLRTRRKEPV